MNARSALARTSRALLLQPCVGCLASRNFCCGSDCHLPPPLQIATPAVAMPAAAAPAPARAAEEEASGA